jgi:hypothetical protein
LITKKFSALQRIYKSNGSQWKEVGRTEVAFGQFGGFEQVLKIFYFILLNVFYFSEGKPRPMNAEICIMFIFGCFIVYVFYFLFLTVEEELSA